MATIIILSAVYAVHCGLSQDVLVDCRNPVTAVSVDHLLPYQLSVGCGDGSVRVYDRRVLGTRQSCWSPVDFFFCCLCSCMFHLLLVIVPSGWVPGLRDVLMMMIMNAALCDLKNS